MCKQCEALVDRLERQANCLHSGARMLPREDGQHPLMARMWCPDCYERWWSEGHD